MMIVGEKTILGFDDFIIAAEEMANQKIETYVVETAISHGKKAAANGIITLNDQRQFAFCDIIEFESAGKMVIKSIKTHVIKL